MAQIDEIIVTESGGQIPVVASVTFGHVIPTLSFAKHAQRVSADGFFRYYQVLPLVLTIPICIQNFDCPIGTSMTPELLARICSELEQVEYIKEE